MRSLRTIIIASLTLLSALPAPVAAQQHTIRFDHLTADNGLSHNNVSSILQDRDGFMWFGTERGLNHYDGYRFTHFKEDPGDSTRLSNDWIHVIYEDSQGTLWLGTDQGINRFDRATGRFASFLHDPNAPQSLLTTRVYSIYEDSRGLLWFGSQNTGLYRYDRATGTFRSFQHDPADPSSVSDDFIISLCEDQAGMLWIGTRQGGLNRFDHATETFTVFRHDPADPSSVNDNGISSLYTDSKGVLWVGTFDGGLNRFDHASESFTHFTHDPDDATSLNRGGVRSIYEDVQGTLWVGTFDGGLNRFDHASASFTRFIHDPDDLASLSFNQVAQIYGDRTGILWIGTAGGGINRFDPAAGSFTHIRHDQNNPNSLSQNSVWSIYEDPVQPAVLWIGTAEGGLNRFDRATGSFTHFTHNPGDPRSLNDDIVEAIYRDRDGVLWVGTQGGLNRLNPDGRSFTRFLDDHPDELHNWIRFIYESPEEPGVLWVSRGAGGLTRFDKQTGTVESFPKDPKNPHSMGGNWASAIHEDENGIFWITSTGGGLNRFDRTTRKARAFLQQADLSKGLPSDEVYSVHEDPAGMLWVGTANGLSRFDPATESFTHLTEENSDLPSNMVYGILDDAVGNLWISTLGGLSEYNPATNTFRNFDVDRGVQARAFNPYAYYKSPSGELFFGGTNGLNSFFPEQIRGNPYPPQVVVTAFELFNLSTAPGEPVSQLNRIAFPKAITLSHRQNDLSFEYVGLHYSNPAKNQYEFTLENYEEAWHPAGTQRTATYTSLEPGTYIFRVKAANRDGVWSEEGASVRIVIKPPWWKTPWAYTLYGLLFVASLVAVDRIQRARLIRKERARAEMREAKLRAEAAELEAKAAAAESRALRAKNEQKEHELEKARELEKAYNKLQKTQDQLIQAEKMASLGQLTAGIAHEIKNPLNFVNNFAEINAELVDELFEELDTDPEIRLDDVKETLNDIKIIAGKINTQGKRADGIVKSMMLHAQGNQGIRERVDLNALLEEFINLAYQGTRAQELNFNVQIEAEYDDAVGRLEVIPQEMGRVFINLLNNAFYAVHEKAGTLGTDYVPTVSVRTKNRGDRVEIRVRDNGTGIPPKVRQRIFEPFFSTKPTGTGTGLGLSLSYDIVVQGHGGTLTVESEAGAFTEFTITLPR